MSHPLPLRPELQVILQIARDPIAATVLRSQCVSIGEYAPDFELPSRDGRPRQLEDMVSEGPLVIMFRHGNWCPACLIETEVVRQRASEITAAGAKLVVIAPDAGSASDGQAPIATDDLFVADPDARIAGVYGLTIMVPPDLARKAGIRLPIIGDNGERGISASAVLIVDRRGLISWAAIDPDHSRLDHASEIVSELRRLQAA